MVIIMKEIGKTERKMDKVLLNNHTIGVMKMADGNKYDGQWKDDKMNGNGIGGL